MFVKAILLTLSSFALLSDQADAHGYLLTPRSRNVVAHDDGVWSGGTASDYPKETCPHCLNLGGTLGRCGVVGDRQYDIPLNVFGQTMPADSQATYDQGSIITVDALLTAHHMGHFEFKACPIHHGEVPTQECFDQNKLNVVSDLRYGAPVDPNYPTRAYIAPKAYASYDGARGGTIFSFEVQLPEALVGDLVLIQWHYLTANSCDFPGYDEYNFPAAWGNMQTGVGECGEIPEDGRGAPEQFWNCAEVTILPSGPVAPTTPSPTYPLPAPTAPTPQETYPPTIAPVPSPTPPTGGNCGGGNIGNGICPQASDCCSKWGYCGSSDAYCNDSSPNPPTPASTPAPTPPVPQTPAPTPVPQTPAPTASSSSTTTSPPTDDWVLSTANRCGASEADARGNCKQTCDSSGECAEGEHCWAVHSNYCGSKPEPQQCDSAPQGGFRCGASELMARETCGAPCSNDGQCAAGESCFALNLNFCDCDGEGQQRKLRAPKNKKN